MPRPRTGSIKKDKRRGLWIARLDWVDETGRKRCKKRVVLNKSEGSVVIKNWLRDLEEHGAAALDGERLAFSRLADIYQEQELVPATYQGETKISGLRSWQSQRRRLKTLLDYFGSKRVRLITPADLRKYKQDRLAIKTWRGDERTIADVNRDLELLRAMFNFAIRNGWITRNPFKQVKGLISSAQEASRDQQLTRDEEVRLLAACQGPRAHLRPILICALDTAMRQGEIFKLEWPEVDLVNDVITIQALNTKTLTRRFVPISARLKAELLRLRELAPENYQGHVFGITNSVKNSFDSVRTEAGLEHLRFHDLRHVACTRLAQKIGLAAIVITGHKTVQVFKRYLNSNTDIVQLGRQAINEFHMRSETEIHLTSQLIN